MNSDTWRPFGMNDTEPSPLYDALHDGVPPWMRKAHTLWQSELLTMIFEGEDGDDRFHSIEQDLRTEIAAPVGATPRGLTSAVLAHFKIREETELALTDYLLSLANIEKNDSLEYIVGIPTFKKIDDILAGSGSKWKLGFRSAGKLGLVQRVPVGVQIAADAAIRASGEAGKTLALAWGAAFGLSPNPREAYRLAVEAVEDAAIPELGFSPKEKPTLGHVIRKINGPDHDATGWTLPFQREDEHYSNGQTLVAMLKTLWAGQADRHGGDHQHTTKTAISQDAAESAILLAVPLVQWFSSGAARSKAAATTP